VTRVAQVAEHATAEARAVAADNARAMPVFFSGAIGVNAAAINGFFEPTQEKGLDGRVLLRKRGDASVIMEHFAGKWRVKSLTDKGKDRCYACVAGGCALEACTSREWKEGTGGKGLVDSPGLKMVTGAEAVEADVSRLPLCCALFMRTHPSLLSALQTPEAKAAAKAKAAADMKAKYGVTLDLLQRLDLQQHIPQFMSDPAARRAVCGQVRTIGCS
jgi:hypothetical protein